MKRLVICIDYRSPECGLPMYFIGFDDVFEGDPLAMYVV